MENNLGNKIPRNWLVAEYLLDWNADEFDDEAFFKAAEKDKARINRQLFFLKIKQLFLKIQYFPTLLKKFLKYSLVGLLQLWGIVLVIFIFIFLYVTDTYSSIYYKVKITVEKHNNENLAETLKIKQKEKIESDQRLKCYKNQFFRIANSEDVIIWYCK